jgi:hypothetical protein
MSRSKKPRNCLRPCRATPAEKERRSQGTLKVPSEWKEGTNTGYVYPRQCFWRSLEYAIHPARRTVPEVWLVHGESDFSLGGHAWVELPDGLVFDAVLQRWYRNYYGSDGQNGRAWYKFTPDAALLIYSELNAGNDGSTLAEYRFDTFLWLPWGDPANPLYIDYALAVRLIATREARKASCPVPLTQKAGCLEATLDSLLGTCAEPNSQPNY